MRVLLLGATGRTGRRVLARLEDAGHDVVTYGRRPGGGARSLTGAIDDAGALGRGLEGAEAAISCLASGNRDPVCSAATRALIEAAARPLRYVVVSGASVAVPGDVRGPTDRAAGALMGLFLGGMLADRARELDRLRASPLAWTALRPPRLTDGRARGAWRFDEGRPHRMKITREDLAGAVVEALTREDLTRRAPFVSEA